MTERDYGVGLETHSFDLNGDGTIDVSVLFQITTHGQDDLVYSLNNIPLFVRVGQLMGVIDESHQDEFLRCRVYGTRGTSGERHAQ